MVTRAIDAGVDFLLSRDPAVADYPAAYSDGRPSAAWFKLGFPSGYVADVLDEPLRLQPQDLGRFRTPGSAEQVGDAPGLPLPAHGSRMNDSPAAETD